MVPQNANIWGKQDNRFKIPLEKNVTPGPGEYKDYSKWNKRTYNLKFLNNQTQAQTANPSISQSPLAGQGSTAETSLDMEKTLKL